METSKSLVFLQIANVGAFIATVLVNALANILPLNGKTTGEISNSYPNLFTPAEYVFSIWGLIYALLLIFVIFQATPGQKETNFLRKIGYFFVLGSIANISWIFLWHYEQIVLSIIPMFVLLGTLIAIYLRLEIGRSNVPLKEKLYVHLPFSVYLGWITVAPIANVASALVAINWDGWGISEVTWTVLVIIVALIITSSVIITRKDIAFSLVIVWALIGIIFKQIEIQSIVITASLSVIVIIVFIVASMLKIKR
ncbi:MAG: hypothetical protein L6N96_06005 [Candidatus Methylarchaceae archaeon HK02M2]|nr:hypothetical protein [Candidatus Methylarchaceae archaeon HK02M2]